MGNENPFIRQEGLVPRKILRAKSAAVVGLGGLGCPASEYLCASGIGKIFLVDRDVVEESNLNRQFLYSREDVSREKALVAKRALASKYTCSKITSVVGDEFDLLKCAKPDVVLDCTDTLASRKSINSAFRKIGVPVVYGGAIGWAGAVASFLPGGFCLECFLSEKGKDETCESRGIVGPVAGAIGCIQAIETLKIVSGLGERERGVRYFDFLSKESWLISVKKRRSCSVCGKTKMKGGSH